MYGLQLERIQSDFKSGLEELMKEKPTKAIFIGTRIGDPNAIGQEQFSLSLHPFFTPLKLLAPVSGLDRVTWPATERRYADDNLIYEIPHYVMILSAECGCDTVAKEEVQDLGVKVALSLLIFYKREISPLLPRSCRYVPTCSQYSTDAYKKYGFVKGSVLTVWRICRCNPFGTFLCPMQCLNILTYYMHVHVPVSL